MKKLLSLVLLLLMVNGCIIHLHGSGKVGAGQSTDWYIYHETELDENGEPKATASLSGRIWDWVFPPSRSSESRLESENGRETGGEGE